MADFSSVCVLGYPTPDTFKGQLVFFTRVKKVLMSAITEDETINLIIKTNINNMSLVISNQVFPEKTTITLAL